MPFTPLDSGLYATSFTSLEVAGIFSDEAHLRRLLEVEAALTTVQARLGIVPREAADAISRAALSLEPDLAALRAGIENDGFPVIELVRQLRERLGVEVAPHVHRGATTQDIVDTALVLQTRAALELMAGSLSRLISTLANLADRHRGTLMAGRTHSQQALPITFGFKVAGWLAPLVRHRARLAELEPRVLVVQLGGAVGTLAALGDRGLEVQSELAAALGLGSPSMPWHTQRDGWVELAGWLSGLTISLGKIAQDVLLLAQSEIGELRESPDAGRGGSSTMPHKSNPITSELILASARTSAGLLSNLHHAAIQEHERGTHGWQMEWLNLGQMIGLCAGALEKAAMLARNLVVNEARMRENVRNSKGLMLAEALSFALAAQMPRSEARALVQELVREVLEQDGHLIDAARARVRVPIQWELLSEERYLGSSNALIDRVLEAARGGATDRAWP